MARALHARDLCRLRLGSQFLLRPRRARASDVVRALGAVQAQDYAGAKWALAQRLMGVTDANIEEEVATGRIVRTHVLRPTWHFVAAEDVRWMLVLTAPRIAAALASYNRTLGLSSVVFRRSNDAIARALEGGRCLTRPELRDILVREGVPASGHRMARLMMQAELDAVACSGPRRGKEFTYALFDDRVPVAAGRDRDEALEELAERYFRTRGPASTHDFSWWSGLSVADAKRAVDILGARVEGIHVDGRPLWRHRAQESIRTRATVAHLLPNYDEYFIGLRDRSAIGRRMDGVGLVTGGDALVTHVAIVNGELVGGWKRQVDDHGVVVTMRLAARVTAAERVLLARQAARLGRVLERPATVHVTTQRGGGATRLSGVARWQSARR